MTKIDKKELFYRTRIIKSMVREMTAKHLAAINRGRKAAGLKPIRMKKSTSKKAPKKAPKKVSKKNGIKKLTKIEHSEEWND